MTQNTRDIRIQVNGTWQIFRVSQHTMLLELLRGNRSRVCEFIYLPKVRCYGKFGV
jgi:hypothetical protein